VFASLRPNPLNPHSRLDPATSTSWLLVVQTIGPSLPQEAQNALDYGESMVARWLAQYMFKAEPDAIARGKAVARHFNDASTRKSHGRRIDRDEPKNVGVAIEDLESSQQLQEAVLTAYHLATIVFEQSPTAKLIASDTGRQWIKSWAYRLPSRRQVRRPGQNRDRLSRRRSHRSDLCWNRGSPISRQGDSANA
jgi:hypothetical protein